MRTQDLIRWISGSAILYAACAVTPAAITQLPGLGADAGGDGGIAVIGHDAMDPTPPAHADPIGGTRLVATTLTAEDGAKQFLGWRDNARGNESCSFQTAADGALRCLPLSAPAPATLFADPACTLPAAVVTSCPPSTAYVTTIESGCPARTHVFKATSGSAYYVHIAGGNCAQQAATSIEHVWAATEEIAPGSFVSATVQ